MQNNRIDLLIELVKTSFKMKYNGSVLGFLWVLLKPFMQFLILYIVFSNAGGNDRVQNFTIYLLTGLVIYSYFNEIFVTGVNALLDKAHIILKVNFNRSLVIYSNVIIGLINLSINFIIILFFALFFPITPTFVSILYFLMIIVILTAFTTGINFFTSIINVQLRDLKHIAEIGMQLLFYATPIFYNINIVPEKLRPFFEYNPLYIVIDACRSAIIYGNIIRVNEILVIGLIALVLLVAGYFFFQSRVKKVAEFF